MPNKELRKQIGQLFMMGFEGRSPTPFTKELLSKYHVGGLVLFARNISEPVQAWELLRALKAPRLLKAVDHEGGRVVRIPPPVTHFPPLERLGQLASSQLATKAATMQAWELAAIGFNLNFAPVLDLRTNPLNRVIGDRAFGPDPKLAERLGPAFIQGIHDVGIAACGKHFPGHGDTREDSHQVLPRVASGEDELARRELIPFKAAFRAGLKAVMTAHVVYEGIDPDHPATLSHAIVTDLLRRKMGFEGVIITDDLEMHGIADHYDADEAAVIALQAGVDMLLFCHSPDRQIAAIEAVYKAVDGRILKADRIAASYHRVQALKAFACKNQAASNRDELLAVLNDDETTGFAASLGEVEQ
jgi:beta-N-acetylhexosaminidase